MWRNGAVAVSSITPLGSLLPGWRRIAPPGGSGVSAVMPLTSSAMEFTVVR
jgi:hypothetical protein